MLRLTAIALVGALAGSLSAQAPAAVSRGTTVRVTTAPIPLQGIGSKKVVGQFDRFVNDTIYLTSGDAPAQYYASRNLLLVEQSVGQRHPYVKGALYGTAFGAAVGFMVYRGTRGPQDASPAFTCSNVNGVLTCVEKPASKASLSIPVGAVAGLVGGMIIGRRITSHKWATVPAGSLR